MSLASTVLEPSAGRPRVDADEGLDVVTVRAPRVPLEVFLRADLDEGAERFFWDAGEEWSFVGRGVAARVDARGHARISKARDGLARVFAKMHDVAVDGGRTPTVRAFGGLSFEPGACEEAPWSGVSDAHFVIPRWTYAVSGDDAVLRLAVRPGDRARAVEQARAVASRVPSWTMDPSLRHEERLAKARVCSEMPLSVWESLVADALATIDAGRMSKVVLSRRAELELGARLDLARALETLAAAEPSAMRFVLDLSSGATLFGATPERLVRVTGMVVETEALAGSIARQHNDADEARALLASDKDRREHAVVVAGIEQALAPLAESVTVEDLRVRTLGAVHHLAVKIRATLLRATHALDVVAALHPTPAVCGLPRDAARAFLREHEPVSRGYYAAPVGWVDARGDGSFAVAIRSALVRGDRAWLHAGAGIVPGSEARTEFVETRVKQRTLRCALGAEP